MVHAAQSVERGRGGALHFSFDPARTGRGGVRPSDRTQNAINGAAGDSYPTPLRATGLGWAFGIGRLGSIAGPLVGSLAIMVGLTNPPHLFYVAVAPMAVAALAAIWLARATKNIPSNLEER